MPMREATPGSEPDLIVFGPHQPVPYTLTPQAEEELDADAEADWAHGVGRRRLGRLSGPCRGRAGTGG